MASNKYQINLVLKKHTSEDDRYEVYSGIVIENHLNQGGYAFDSLETPDKTSGVINVQVNAIAGDDDDGSLLKKEMESAFGCHGDFSIG